MQITRNTATMFIELSTQISQELGVNIGYIHPRVALVQDTTEFVIREPSPEIHSHDDEDDIDKVIQTTTETDGIQFLHMSDLKYSREHGVFSHWIEEIKSDDKVQELMDKVEKALMEGKIGFAPGVTRSLNGETMSITQRITSGGTVVYELPIIGPYGQLWTYDTVVSLASQHNAFAFAKKIIDDQWPEEWGKYLRKEVARQADEPNDKSSISLLDKARNLFRKLFE